MSDHSRRDFVNWLLGLGTTGWLGTVLYPILKYLNPPRIPEPKVSSLKVGKTAEFAPGSSKIFQFGTQPVILVRTDSGEFRAFSATCTHLNCTVQYRPDWKVIWCACHNGKYDLTGNVASGPPPRPLDVFQVVIQNDEITIAREPAK